MLPDFIHCPLHDQKARFVNVVGKRWRPGNRKRLFSMVSHGFPWYPMVWIKYPMVSQVRIKTQYKKWYPWFLCSRKKKSGIPLGQKRCVFKQWLEYCMAWRENLVTAPEKKEKRDITMDKVSNFFPSHALTLKTNDPELGVSTKRNTTSILGSIPKNHLANI